MDGHLLRRNVNQFVPVEISTVVPDVSLVIQPVLYAMVQLTTIALAAATSNFSIYRQINVFTTVQRDSLEIWKQPTASLVLRAARNATITQNVCHVNQVYCLLATLVKHNAHQASFAPRLTLVNHAMGCAKSAACQQPIASSVRIMMCWVMVVVLVFAQLGHFCSLTRRVVCHAIPLAKHAQDLLLMIALDAKVDLSWWTQDAWHLAPQTTTLTKKLIAASNVITTVQLVMEVSFSFLDTLLKVITWEM